MDTNPAWKAVEDREPIMLPAIGEFVSMIPESVVEICDRLDEISGGLRMLANRDLARRSDRPTWEHRYDLACPDLLRRPRGLTGRPIGIGTKVGAEWMQRVLRIMEFCHPALALPHAYQGRVDDSTQLALVAGLDWAVVTRYDDDILVTVPDTIHHVAGGANHPTNTSIEMFP